MLSCAFCGSCSLSKPDVVQGLIDCFTQSEERKYVSLGAISICCVSSTLFSIDRSFLCHSFISTLFLSPLQCVCLSSNAAAMRITDLHSPHPRCFHVMYNRCSVSSSRTPKIPTCSITCSRFYRVRALCLPRTRDTFAKSSACCLRARIARWICVVDAFVFL